MTTSRSRGSRPDAELGEVPVAFVVARNGAEVTRERVDAFLRDRGLARYKWPVAVRQLEALPLSGPGKVDRKALRQDALRQDAGDL